MSRLDDLEAELQQLWEKTRGTATKAGTTYGVDAVGKCISLVRQYRYNVQHHEKLREMLGQRVRVKLDESVVEEGILLGWGDGGDVELEGSDGLVYHAWPRLHIELAGDGKESARSRADGPIPVNADKLRPYIDQCVAVKDGEVIASAEFFSILIQGLRDSGIRADAVFRVPRDPRAS